MVESRPIVDLESPVLFLLSNVIRRFERPGEDKARLLSTNLSSFEVRRDSDPMQLVYGLTVVSGRDPSGPTLDLQAYRTHIDTAGREHDILLERMRELGLRAELVRRGILTISQISVIDHLPAYHLGPSWEAMAALMPQLFPNHKFVPKIP